MAWENTWRLYSLDKVIGIRDKFYFRWSIAGEGFDSLFEDGLELGLYDKLTGNSRGWRAYDPDYVIGYVGDGNWYVYHLYATPSNNGGYDDHEVHIGDFPSFERAFFALIGYLGDTAADNIAERRHERRMDAIIAKAEADSHE
ncbi:MAG TPA: hypothetical protein PLU64_12260 [Saprospiraceae bacterium]|nr:hypothetical protein [Saprospiraceae bacterium]